MKFCKDCKFYVPYQNYYGKAPQCENPNNRSFEDGSPYFNPEALRRWGECGPGAKWFEEKEKLQ